MRETARWKVQLVAEPTNLKGWAQLPRLPEVLREWNTRPPTTAQCPTLFFDPRQVSKVREAVVIVIYGPLPLHVDT